MEVNQQNILHMIFYTRFEKSQLVLRFKGISTPYALQGACENRNEDKTMPYQQTQSFKPCSVKNSNNKSVLDWGILMTVSRIKRIQHFSIFTDSDPHLSLFLD